MPLEIPSGFISGLGISALKVASIHDFVLHCQFPLRRDNALLLLEDILVLGETQICPRERSPCACSRLRQTGERSLESNSGEPSVSCKASPRKCMSRKLGWKAEPELGPRHASRGCRHLGRSFNCCAECLS